MWSARRRTMRKRTIRRKIEGFVELTLGLPAEYILIAWIANLIPEHSLTIHLTGLILYAILVIDSLKKLGVRV